MIHFKELTIKNFLSYGEAPTVISLDKIGTTLIVGEDLDNTASGTGANGVGKAQPLHCKIKTPSGWITMGDASIGDLVSTPDGGTATIIGVFPQGKLKTYKISFADGRTTEACGEHLWKVNSHRWQENHKSNASKIISTEKLKHYVDIANTKNKSWYNCTVPMIIHDDRNDVQLPIDPYLIGALLGDGTICYRNIRFSSIDESIINNVSTLLENGFEQELAFEKDANYYVRNVVSKVGRNPISDSLDSLKLLGTHSNDKFIPDIYLYETSKKQKIEIIQGLMDTDGTVGKNGAVSYCTTSIELANNFQYLIRSIGGKAKISNKETSFTYNGTKKKGKLAYNILVQYQKPKELFTLERKKARILDNVQYANAGLRVVSVEEIGEQIAQCIMIDHHEHLYITDDFITTHNTVWVNALIYGLYGKPISEISMDNLVNNINKKNMRVDVEFEKDEKVIHIRRARKEKGIGNYAKVFVRPIDVALDEEAHDVTPASVNDVNGFIVDILGIPYELFVRIVAFAATHTPFLSLPVRSATKANQSDIMEELFRLTRLSSKADGVKQQIKDTKQSLDIKIRHNDQLEIEHERHNKQLETALNRVEDWKADHKTTLKSLNDDLEQLKAVPIKEQEALYKRVDIIKGEILDVKVKQTEAEKSVTDVSTKLTVVRAQLKTVKTARDKIIKWKEDNVKTIANLKKVADDLPRDYYLDEQRKLNETVTSIRESITDFEERADGTDKHIEKSKEELYTLKDEQGHLEDAKCPYCLQQFENVADKLKECKTGIKHLTKGIKTYEKLLTVLEDNIEVEEVNLSDAQDDIELSMYEIQTAEQSRKNCVEKLEELLNARNPHGTKAEVADMFDAVGSLEKDITKYTNSLNKKSDVLIEIDDIVDGLEKELKTCKLAITFDSIEDLYDIKNEIKVIEHSIESSMKDINPYNDPLQELKDIIIEPVDMDTVNELDNLLIHQNYMVKLLTKKDSFIRKNLLTKNLKFLNQRLSHYLRQLGLPHKVEFTEEMTANITQFGRELDFGNLSSGQKARVNLGLSFSFRDVLQKSHDSINVCMLDEVLDVGLDSVGVQNAARMLKHKAREENLALYIISHRDEVSNIFDNRMVVQMEKGFSSVKVEK